MLEHIITRCETVVDGDTINVRHEGRLRTVRIQHIDAPEVGEAFYLESKVKLMELVLGHQLTIYGVTYDRYGRLVGKIFTEELEMPHLALVAEGLAFHYTKYSTCKLTAAAQSIAKLRNLNLWSEEEFYFRWLQRVNEGKRYVRKGEINCEVPEYLLTTILEDFPEQIWKPEVYQKFEEEIQREALRAGGIKIKEIKNLIQG